MNAETRNIILYADLKARRELYEGERWKKKLYARKTRNHNEYSSIVRHGPKKN